MYDSLDNDDNDNDSGSRGGVYDRGCDLGDMMMMAMAVTMMQNAKWWSWLSSS